MRLVNKIQHGGSPAARGSRGSAAQGSGVPRRADRGVPRRRDRGSVRADRIIPAGELRAVRVALSAVFAAHGLCSRAGRCGFPPSRGRPAPRPPRSGWPCSACRRARWPRWSSLARSGRRFGSARLTVISCALLSVTVLLPPAGPFSHHAPPDAAGLRGRLRVA